MRRILFLNAVAEVGGAERCLLDLLASLRRAEPAAELHLAVAADGPLVGLAQGLGVAVTVLPMPGAVRAFGDSSMRGQSRWRAAIGLARQAARAAPATWRYARQLHRLVGSLRPAVVHSNSMKFHLLCRLARLRGPLVVWHLHDFPGARPVMSRALRWAARAAAGAIAVSHAVANDARAILGSVPVEVVYNGVDDERFSPGPGDGDRLDRLAGLPPAGADAVRVGLVATYARWKGQDVFLDAAAKMAQLASGRAVRFYVVGGPIYQTAGSQWSEGELRQRAGPLLAEGRVGFVPFQADPAAVYRALDVVVHASTLPEPFGLTIVEAMACGRAAIVTRAGGAAELFTDGHDALAVPPGDAEALAAAIGRLTADPGLRARLGHNARRTAVERFRSQRLGPQVLAAYAAFRLRRPDAPEFPSPC